MKVYAISIGAGVLVGVIYGLLNVRSPAPPIIALLGLLGILLGEQLVPLGKRVVAGEPLAALLRCDCAAHLFGALPGHHGAPPTAPRRDAS